MGDSRADAEEYATALEAAVAVEMAHKSEQLLETIKDESEHTSALCVDEDAGGKEDNEVKPDAADDEGPQQGDVGKEKDGSATGAASFSYALPCPPIPPRLPRRLRRVSPSASAANSPGASSLVIGGAAAGSRALGDQRPKDAGAGRGPPSRPRRRARKRDYSGWLVTAAARETKGNLVSLRPYLLFLLGSSANIIR